GEEYRFLRPCVIRQFFTGEEKHEHEGLLRQRIADRGEISREFRSRGLTDMASAAAYIRRLPYGCNTDRGDFRRVLREGKGTCSTKHALLVRLAQEQGIPLERAFMR